MSLLYISQKRSSHKARNGTVTRGRMLTKRRYAGINNKEVEGKCRWKDEKLRGRRKNATLDDFTLRIETPNPFCTSSTYIHQLSDVIFHRGPDLLTIFFTNILFIRGSNH